uniref:Uncharacterized protein n=1 Tax=Panagrolaimus superbus TaxID=310955 RepID=A0A914XUP9_9BILA
MALYQPPAHIVAEEFEMDIANACRPRHGQNYSKFWVCRCEEKDDQGRLRHTYEKLIVLYQTINSGAHQIQNDVELEFLQCPTCTCISPSLMKKQLHLKNPFINADDLRANFQIHLQTYRATHPRCFLAAHEVLDLDVE